MSKVISLRVSDAVYDMACFCKNEEIKAFEKAQSEGALLPNIVQLLILSLLLLILSLCPMLKKLLKNTALLIERGCYVF